MIIETIVVLYQRILRGYEGPYRIEQATEHGESVFLVRIPPGTEHEFVPEVLCGSGMTRVVVAKDLNLV